MRTWPYFSLAEGSRAVWVLLLYFHLTSNRFAPLLWTMENPEWGSVSFLYDQNVFFRKLYSAVWSTSCRFYFTVEHLHPFEMLPVGKSATDICFPFALYYRWYISCGLSHIKFLVCLQEFGQTCRTAALTILHHPAYRSKLSYRKLWKTLDFQKNQNVDIQHCQHC